VWGHRAYRGRIAGIGLSEGRQGCRRSQGLGTRGGVARPCGGTGPTGGGLRALGFPKAGRGAGAPRAWGPVVGWLGRVGAHGLQGEDCGHWAFRRPAGVPALPGAGDLGWGGQAVWGHTAYRGRIADIGLSEGRQGCRRCQGLGTRGAAAVIWLAMGG